MQGSVTCNSYINFQDLQHLNQDYTLTEKLKN
jgi:hypothetical protein